MSTQGALPISIDPVAHGLRHYVVVLQNRKGEREALRQADDEVRSRITPIFAFRPRGTSDQLLGRSTPRNWVRALSELMAGRPCFLDVQSLEKRLVDGKGKTTPAPQELFAAARDCTLVHVPVLPTKCNKALRRLVLEGAYAGGTGVALRHQFMAVMEPPEKHRERLSKLMEQADMDIEEVDLLLDAEFLDGDDEVAVAAVAELVDAAASIGPWRSFALLGTSIPATMGIVQEGSVGSLARKEWELWKGIQARRPTRMPVYGDYAVQHPRRPSSTGLGMRANIRYTTSDQVLVARGEGALFEHGAAQYRDLCAWLKDHPEYCGPDYSWGDMAIGQVAAGLVPPAAGQDHWRAVGTSHHLRFVVDQLT